MTTGKRHLDIAMLLVALVAAGAFWCTARWAINDIDDLSFSMISALENRDGATIVVHNKPVDSLADAMSSQAVDYRYSNGRFLIHTLAQWFVGTQSLDTFAVANSLVFLLFIAAFMALAVPRPRRLWQLLVACSLVWLAMPTGLVMFLGSVTSSLDYLWTGAATLCLLCGLKHWESMERVPAWQLPLIAVAAMAAGSMQESYSIGVSAALLLHAWRRRHHLNNAVVTLIVAYLLGTAVCVLAPANFKRVNLMGGYGPHMGAVRGLLQSPATWLLAASMAVAFFKNRPALRATLREHHILAVAMAVNFLFAFMVGFTGVWQLTGIFVFALIITAHLWCHTWLRRPAAGIAAATALVALAAVVHVPAARARHLMHDEQERIFESVRRNSEPQFVSVEGATQLTSRLRRSALWPLSGRYVVLHPQAMVNDDQRCCRLALSRFVTHCEDAHRVKAILPCSPAKIEATFTPANAAGQGVHFVGEDFAALRLVRRVPMDDVSVTVEMRSLLPGHSKQVRLAANQAYEYNGRHYYIFGFSLLRDKLVKVLSVNIQDSKN